MVQPKKRSKELEPQTSASDESAKLRKKLRALVAPAAMPKMDALLVDAFVKMLKSSLFMHHGRLMEVWSVIQEVDAENERLKGVCRLMEILRRPPPVHSFLSDMLLLFLTPEEALDLNCYEVYRSRMQSLEILLKAHQRQRLSKARPLSKGPFRPLHESDAPESVDPKSIYGSFVAWLGSDSRLCDFLLPLFPDQLVDSSNVSINEYEVIRSDFLHDHESDEFEVINWTDAFENDQPSFRHCSCSCHQPDNAANNAVPVSHCGLCTVKFFNEQAYVWRGGRLVRAQIELSDCEEQVHETSEDIPTTISPSKIFSSNAGFSDTSSEWGQVFQAIDSLENGDYAIDSSSVRNTAMLRTTSTTPRKSIFGQDPAQDVLKQAFMETFGRNLWGKGYSPLKRPGGPSFGIGGPIEESNSASYVFIRGYDGANTMLATVAADSNSSATPSYSGARFVTPESSNTLRDAEKTNDRMPPTVPAEVQPKDQMKPEAATGEREAEAEPDTWTEDDDRYLLDQFKLHRNVYEAATAAMSKLGKSRHAVRDRLKLLLDLLKEVM